LDFVRKSKLQLKKLHTFESYFRKEVGPNKQVKKKGRPQKYEDAWIITLWLFQILNNYSYREALEKAKDEGFKMCHPFATTTTELNRWMMNF
jgi:hypothetical protein